MFVEEILRSTYAGDFDDIKITSIGASQNLFYKHELAS